VYGKNKPYQPYYVGNEISCNNSNYYVIADSSINQEYVLALKKEPLTSAELGLYGNNHINNYSSNGAGAIYVGKNGYAGVAYYSSDTCGYVNGDAVNSGCSTSYDSSDIKYIVDAWAEDNFKNNELVYINGYKSRLITYQEAINIGCTTTAPWSCPEWLSSPYMFWTMTGYENYNDYVRLINDTRNLFRAPIYNYSIGTFAITVRPVINIYKSKIKSSNNL